MTDTKYAYVISTDFPNAKADPARLESEIQASTITVALKSIVTEGDVCDVWFKAELSAEEQTTLDGLVAAHSGEPIEPEGDPTTPSGIPLVVPAPREGPSVNFVTHNWADPCTWFGQSVRETGLELVGHGNGKLFSSHRRHWIDLNHGRYYREDLIKAAYLPKVYVDGVEKTERAPFADSGGDYIIDYVTGTVEFFETPSGTVTADFSYANGSRYTIAPTAGKKLIVENSEVQFSEDLVMNDTIHFQAWAYNPMDPPNKVPVTEATTYKTIRDFVDEARGVYPVIPRVGGSERGLTTAHIVFPFNYKTVKELAASYGLEIRVWLDGDIPYEGKFATATFYCTSKDE
jgi:hypothetical protein